MAGLHFSFFIILLVSCLSESIEESSSDGGMKVEGSDLNPKKMDEALDGKNAISQLMSDSAFFPTESVGEQIISQKVLEIVKNPVHVDLNKLPSDVIEKIAEGGVTTPKTDARALEAEEKKVEVVPEEKKTEEQKAENVTEDQKTVTEEGTSAKSDTVAETTTVTEAAESRTAKENTE